MVPCWSWAGVSIGAEKAIDLPAGRSNCTHAAGDAGVLLDEYEVAVVSVDGGASSSSLPERCRRGNPRLTTGCGLRSSGSGRRHGSGRGRSHLTALAAEERSQEQLLGGAEQDDHVECERPVLDVEQVEPLVGVERRVVASLDLPEAGDARDAPGGVRGARSGNSSTSVRKAGRGPTRLISPFSTLISWGSSSRLVRRRKWPIRVTRGSTPILNSGPERWLSRLQLVRAAPRRRRPSSGT